MSNWTLTPSRLLTASKYAFGWAGIGQKAGLIALIEPLPAGSLIACTRLLGNLRKPGGEPSTDGKSGLTKSTGTYAGRTPASLPSAPVPPLVAVLPVAQAARNVLPETAAPVAAIAPRKARRLMPNA